MYSHCEDGGWKLGHLINGTQAEYVRIPHADNSLYLVPEGEDEEALSLTDRVNTITSGRISVPDSREANKAQIDQFGL
jgi:threonine dehydrogenase-like Zn-dependent dehydrogenase